MKKSRPCRWPAAACAGVLFAVAAPVLAAAEHAPNPGTIRPAGEVNRANLPALTKITFEAALHAALAAVPGQVLKAELEIEHGSLLYSFEIVAADKSIKEVEIDAGNAAVLDLEED